MENKIYKKILAKTPKYFWLGVGEKKAKIISKGNSKTESRNEAKEFLKPYLDDMIGDSIYLVQIDESVKNGEWDKEKNFLLPGPIYAEFKKYRFSKSGKLKLDKFERRSKLFFSPEYLKKNKSIEETQLKNFCFKFANQQTRQGLISADVI